MCRKILLISVVLALANSAYGISFTLNAVVDTWLDGANRDTNYGSDIYLQGNETYNYPMTWFDVSGITDVTYAALRYEWYESGQSGQGVYAFAWVNDWAEDTYTWNLALAEDPCVSGSDTNPMRLIAENAGMVRMKYFPGTDTPLLSPGSTGVFFDVNVLPAVQDWTTGALDNYGFLGYTGGGSNNMTFYSQESSQVGPPLKSQASSSAMTS